MNKGRFKFCLSMLLLFCLLTGCWDVLDISKRAFITAIGLDRAADPENKYKVTFEIVNPFMLNDPNYATANIVQTVEGDSIGEILEVLQARINRPLSLSHLRVLVIGEEQARQDFRDVWDFFHRHRDVQLRLRLLIVQGEDAKDIIETKPLFDKYLAEELVSLTRVKPLLSYANVASIHEVYRRLAESDGRGLVSRTILTKDDSIVIHHGGGVYNNWKLIGWLNKDEIQEINWILGNANATIDTKIGEGIYSFNVDKKSCMIKPFYENQQVSFDIMIKIDGRLLQQQGEHMDMTQTGNIIKLQDAFSRNVKSQTEAAISEAQKNYRVDYLCLDSSFQKHFPEVYKNLDWEEIFPNIPVNVSVKTNITRFGLAP